MRLKPTFLTFTLALSGAMSLPAQDQVSLTVDSTMDIYRAGGYNDGSNGAAPVVFSFPAAEWRTMTFPSAGGQWGCQEGLPEYGADGTTSGPCLVNGGPTNLNAIGPLSGYHLTDLQGAMVGVFLEDALPPSPPAALRFYASNSADGGIQTDFPGLAPKIGQIFFIGDGLTGAGGGTIQTFFVPPTATHLYLGYVDNCRAPNNTTPGCYSDNVGSVNVTARLLQYVPGWYQPTLSSAPSARIAPSMAYDAATFSTVLFGGCSAYSGGATYGDTWTFTNAKGWAVLSPPRSPPERCGAAMAYDPTTGTVVLFGGNNNTTGSIFGDTWTWNGVTWTQQFPPVSPPARAPTPFSMAYDPVTETILLFGGGVSNSFLGDTWTWNGRTKSWTQLFPATSPSPRLSFLTYDAATKNIVLFGGEDGGPYLGDTWTWDGVNWTQQFPTNSPSARTRQAMAYDASLDLVILFGGTPGPPSSLNDTWAWTGKTWEQLSLYNGPSSRYVSSMVYDPLTNGLLLFGGETSGNNVTNQTWLLIPVPLR